MVDIRVDCERELWRWVAVGAAGDQEPAVSRFPEAELAAVGEDVLADEAEGLVALSGPAASIGHRSTLSCWACEKSRIVS